MAVLLALLGVGAVLIAVAAAPLRLEARLRVPGAVLRRRVDVAFVGLALVLTAAISWVVAGAST